MTVPSTRGEDDDDFNIGIRETEEDNGNLSCPICHLEFERTPENAQNLVAHVDEHLVEELKCPVCFITFNKSHQNAFENHVNVSRYHVCTSVINKSNVYNINRYDAYLISLIFYIFSRISMMQMITLKLKEKITLHRLR